MNYKIFFTFLFAAILAISAASALTLVSSNVPSSVSSTATSMPVSFTVNNTDPATTVTVTLAGSITSPAGSSVSFPSSTATIAPNTSSSFTATVNLPAVKSGNVVGQITATPSSGATVTIPLNVPISSSVNFCRSGQQGGNLSISDFTIDTDGDDEETWKPLDVITIEVEVENTGDDDIDDIQVELGLFDSAGRNQVNDLDFSNEDEEQFDLGDLNDGDEETATFEFMVPADFDAGDYQLKVKVYSDKQGESNQCVDTSTDFDQILYQSIDVEEEDDEGKFIAFDNVEFNPTEATCGDQVTLSFDAYNIGDDDQDQVKILVESNDLRISQSEEIKQGLDQGDHGSMLFTFTVPQGLADKTYSVDLSAEYDYKNGVYREESDEVTKYSIKVFGCGVGSNNNGNTGTNKAAISASLDSEAKAGERLVVTARITNTQSTDASFVIDASGYQSWAELSDVSDRIVEIDAGESEEVTFTFAVDEDAEGRQDFTIEATSGNSVTTRDVVVELDERSAAGSVFGGNSGLIWGIAIVNVVLLIAIILVAIKLSRN